jgi:hypothetical protein
MAGVFWPATGTFTPSGVRRRAHVNVAVRSGPIRPKRRSRHGDLLNGSAPRAARRCARCNTRHGATHRTAPHKYAPRPLNPSGRVGCCPLGCSMVGQQGKLTETARPCTLSVNACLPYEEDSGPTPERSVVAREQIHTRTADTNRATGLTTCKQRLHAHACEVALLEIPTGWCDGVMTAVPRLILQHGDPRQAEEFSESCG